jgi:hypothetical protein
MFDLTGLTREEVVSHSHILEQDGMYFLQIDERTFVALARAAPGHPFMVYQFTECRNFVRLVVQGVEGTLPSCGLGHGGNYPDGTFWDESTHYDAEAHQGEVGPFVYGFEAGEDIS